MMTADTTSGKRIYALERGLADQQARFAATTKILQIIKTSKNDAQPVFDAIAKSATELCRTQFCMLWRYDGSMIHYCASSGFAPEFREGINIPVAGSFDVGNTLEGHPGQAKIAGTFKDTVNRVVAIENNVQSVFHLAEIVVAAQVDAFAFVFRELRSQFEGPIVETFLNAPGVETVGDSLYRSRYKECIRMLNGLEKSLEKHVPESDRRWPTEL